MCIIFYHSIILINVKFANELITIKITKKKLKYLFQKYNLPSDIFSTFSLTYWQKSDKM